MEMQFSFLSLQRILNFMRILGVYPIEKNSTKNQHRWHKIFRCGAFFYVVLYMTQQMLKIYEVQNDADKIMATMFLFLTYTDYVCKIIVILKKQEQIEEILRITKGPIYNQGEPEHREILLQAAKNAVIVGRVFNYMSAFTSCLISLHPIVQRLRGKIIEFSVWLPFETHLTPQFYVAVIYASIQHTWTALGNSSLDIFIICLLQQCKTQMSILRLDLGSVIEKCSDEKSKTSHTFNNILERRLKNIIKHHNEINSMAEKIQDVFSGAVFYQFFVAGWILCTSAYNMSMITPTSVQFLSLIFYILCISMECGLYCYYGNDVTLESELLTRAVYEMDWLSISPKHRRILIIFMERCKRPINPLAGKIIPLSNTTFVSIIRSSYTFYVFLKNSRNKA